MPHDVAPELLGAIVDVRRKMLDLKLESEARGPVYQLAQSITVLTDLVERLLSREHEHTAPYRDPTFGGA